MFVEYAHALDSFEGLCVEKRTNGCCRETMQCCSMSCRPDFVAALHAGGGGEDCPCQCSRSRPPRRHETAPLIFALATNRLTVMSPYTHLVETGPERVVEKVVTVEVEKPVIQKSVMQVQQRSSPQQIRAENPEIVYAPPLVVRQEQPARAYRGDWTEVDELRRQVSREELHSHADQIYHSMSKVAIGE